MNRIAELRKKQDLTQGQLADMLHVSQGTLSKWENDTHHPSNEDLFALADIFGVSIDYMLGYADGESSVTLRMLKEYIASRFKVRLRESEIETIDVILEGIIKLSQERLTTL